MGRVKLAERRKLVSQKLLPILLRYKMLGFKEYWAKYYPTMNKAYARKRWDEYLEVSEASTDFEKKPMNSNNAFNLMVETMAYAKPVSFDTCVSTHCQMTECKPAQCVPNKGNNPMYVDNDKHIESSKINYLSERLSNSFYGKVASLPAAFNLDTPKVPETPEKLVEAITSGNYTIKPKAERNVYDRVTNQIVWRSPSIVPDQTGYNAAMKALEDLKQTAKDSIVVDTPENALAAIKAIDAYTPVTATAQ